MFYAQPYTLEEINTILDEAENDFENGSFIPNEETIAAINEAMLNKNHGKVYSDAKEMINDLLNEEEYFYIFTFAILRIIASHHLAGRSQCKNTIVPENAPILYLARGCLRFTALFMARATTLGEEISFES